MSRFSIEERSGIIATHRGIPKNFFLRSDNTKLVDVLEKGLLEVEERLHQNTQFVDVFAQTAGRYLLVAGGKRVRPSLTILTAQLGQGTTEQVLTAAQIVEMTHLASLYHDDVMDEAQIRRGIPSAQNVWGNSVAVLTGDLLFARASRLVASLGARAVELQAETFERLCLGQLRETVGPSEGENPVEHYISVLKDKTGSLISTAARLGVLFSGADARYEQPVYDFGEKIGIAFQLIDDVIDLSSDGSSQTGKTPGNDLRAGVATLPFLKLQELAYDDPKAQSLVERLQEHVMGAQDEGELTHQAWLAIQALREHDVTVYTEQMANDFAAQAIVALDSIEEGPVKNILIRFARSVVDRTK